MIASRANGRRRSLRMAPLTCLLATLAACATWQAPKVTDESALRERAVTAVSRGVEVSAAVLSAEDSMRLLGTDVTVDDVQPVWIEIRNDTDRQLWLLRSGVDPDYFSPLEVAWSSHVTLGGSKNRRIDEHFDRLAFKNPIPEQGSAQGILFTNRQPERKLVNIDLIGDRVMIPFTLLLPVPGEAVPGGQLIHPYAANDITPVDDLDALRRAIEALPCCATPTADEAAGQPLNVILVGRLDDLTAALARRGFRRDASAADPAQQAFGRPAELVLRKRAKAGSSATWLRIWRAPLSYRDEMVFVAQAGRPAGGRFLPAGSDGRRVHPDVDEVRNLLLHDFMYSGGLEMIGIVKASGGVPTDRQQAVPGSDFFTDGRRIVMFIGTRPRTLSEVQVLDWEPLLPQDTDNTALESARALQ